MTTVLVNKESEEEKTIPSGFSWTTLFFGIFVPLLRGYWPYFFGLLILCFFGGIGIFIAWFVCPFLINNHYRDHMLKNGWTTKEKHLEKKQREDEDRLFRQAMLAKAVN
ncbi:hypothetical protein C9J12_28845 [Photobacterium frigidiphilum]|uniref:DUF2628 domain-containing protein n=1 Tax=Photobacterium frigidiphilum TaxID=264736 RepID=A0A2T3J624_9GAMM|nr:hypothetical protein [Photobacterium frigidiphilum]PSU42606.1 hypothetical protein C9J12_28845 [Photobacterium frigidiphilum]